MKTIKGDLITEFLKGEFKVMIHGANCFKRMKSGIAGQISNRLPEAQFADTMYGTEGDHSKLSNYSVGTVRKENGTVGMVINLYTQFKPGPDLYEEALLLGFKKIAKDLKQGTTIGIPEIGCGIAGGDWSIICPKIAEIMKDHDVTWVEYVSE